MIISQELLVSGLVLLVIFVISAFPLHRAVRIFKPKTKFHKTLFVVIFSGVVISLINSFFSVWAGFIAFVFLIWIYRKAFKLKWYNSVVVWFLQLVFVVVSSIIFSFLMKAISGFSVFFS